MVFAGRKSMEFVTCWKKRKLSGFIKGLSVFKPQYPINCFRLLYQFCRVAWLISEGWWLLAKIHSRGLFPALHARESSLDADMVYKRSSDDAVFYLHTHLFYTRICFGSFSWGRRYKSCKIYGLYRVLADVPWRDFRDRHHKTGGCSCCYSLNIYRGRSINRLSLEAAFLKLHWWCAMTKHAPR